MKKILFLVSTTLLVFSCSTSNSSESESADSLAVESEFIEYNNPPADGFNVEGSDVLAMLLADKSMQAMGGRKAWDDTRYISWNFFGRRDHLWDKSTGDVRIEVPSSDLTILMNIKDKEGKVFKGGEELTDSTDYFLQKGYEWWVNDAYWLVMPYKLKDSGVTLKYLREDTTMDGTLADVVQLSFSDVGVTPENLYEVWIEADSKLVTQWAYYPDSNSQEPRFVTPWADYNEYGEILLSGNRGDYNLSKIKVLDSIPQSVLVQPSPDISSIR